MGAVRIYKEDIGDKYPWHVRAGGCDFSDSTSCRDMLGWHVHCNDYHDYEDVIADLNDPEGLGEYLKK